MRIYLQQVLLSLVLVGGTIVGLPIVEAKEKLNISVTVDDAQLKGRGEGVTGAWIGYALARANWISEHVEPGTPLAGTYSRSFEEELAGREALVKIWGELKEKDSKLADPYLDGLGSVVREGFVKEYVWTHLRGKEWKEPSPPLRLEEFAQWMKVNWPTHQAETCADVKIERKGGK
jgi:hypothetical protein